MKKRIIIVLGIMTALLLVFILANYNAISSAEYIRRNAFNFVDIEVSALSDGDSEIYIYRSSEGIHVVLLEWRSILGWKMTEINGLSFDQGPSWNYVETELENNPVVSLVYGFFYDDPQNYKSLNLLNPSESIDVNPSSNLSFRTEIRAWYYLIEGRSFYPEDFELIDRDLREPIYQ